MAKKPAKRVTRGATKKRAHKPAQPNEIVTEVDGKPPGDAVNEQIAGTDQGQGASMQNDELIQLAREIYEAGFNKDRENQDEAYKDLKMLAGEDHWDTKAATDREAEGRPALVVNQMPQFVRQVTGDMRQMRPGIKVVPITDDASEDIAAKVLPGMIRYVETRSEASGIYFQAADQQVAAGIGHFMVTHEYSGARTFNQELRIAPVPDGIAVVWDADSVLLTREDANDCFVPYDISRRTFEATYPGKSAEPLTSSAECFSSWFSDDHVRVAIWFHRVKEMKRLAAYPDGRIDDVTDDDEGEQLAVSLGAEIKEREGFCVYRYLISANDILEGPDGDSDEEKKKFKVPGPNIPVVPMIGEEVIIGRRTVRRGVLRVLRDVQRIFNYAISTQTEVIALQPKAPFIGTRRQFEKYIDQWETANSKNWPFLEYEHEAGVPPPQRAQPAVSSTGLDDLMIKTTEAMYSTTGIYPSALGKQSNETSGRAIMARQREGDTGTYVYLDNFARALRRCGQICVDMMPDVYDTQRTIMIVGEDGKIDKMQINQAGLGDDAEAHIALNDVTKGAYLVTIEMGPSYATKREEAREGMLELIRTLGPQGAMLFLDLLIKAMDWPLADQIAKRAEANLPHEVRVREAQEAGREPPPPPQPPPLTPEQQQVMEEAHQANIEKARENEIGERNHVLELDRVDLERARVAKERAGLAVESRGQDLEARRQDVEAVGLGAQEIDNQRKIAGGEQPAKGRASPAGDVDTVQTAEIDELKGHVADLTEELLTMRELIGELAKAASGGELDINVLKGGPPQQDDATKQLLLAILQKVSEPRRMPKGVKRTSAGMELVFDDMPPPAPAGPPVAAMDPGGTIAMGEQLPPIP